MGSFAPPPLLLLLLLLLLVLLMILTLLGLGPRLVSRQPRRCPSPSQRRSGSATRTPP